MAPIQARNDAPPPSKHSEKRVRNEDIRVRCTAAERAELWARYSSSGCRSWTEFILLVSRDRVPIIADQRVLAGLSRSAAALGGLVGGLWDVRSQLQAAIDALARLEGGHQGAAADAIARANEAIRATEAEVGRASSDGVAVRAELRGAIRSVMEWMEEVECARSVKARRSA